LGEGRPANVAQRIKCHVSEIVALVSNQTLRVTETRHGFKPYRANEMLAAHLMKPLNQLAARNPIGFRVLGLVACSRHSSMRMASGSEVPSSFDRLATTAKSPGVS